MRQKIKEFRKYLSERRGLIAEASEKCGVKHKLRPDFPCTQPAGHKDAHVNAKGDQWESSPSNIVDDE